MGQQSQLHEAYIITVGAYVTAFIILIFILLTKQYLCTFHPILYYVNQEQPALLRRHITITTNIIVDVPYTYIKLKDMCLQMLIDVPYCLIICSVIIKAFYSVYMIQFGFSCLDFFMNA